MVSTNSLRYAYVNGVAGAANTTTMNISGFDRMHRLRLQQRLSWRALKRHACGYWPGMSRCRRTIGRRWRLVFRQRLVRPDALVGYWPLHAARATDREDWVGGRHMTANNGPDHGRGKSAHHHSGVVFAGCAGGHWSRANIHADGRSGLAGVDWQRGRSQASRKLSAATGSYARLAARRHKGRAQVVCRCWWIRADRRIRCAQGVPPRCRQALAHTLTGNDSESESTRR